MTELVLRVELDDDQLELLATLVAARLGPREAATAPGAGSDLHERLTTAEAAALARCSTRTIRDAIRLGALDACRAGRTFAIARDDLLRWLDGHRVPPRSRQRGPRSAVRPSRRGGPAAGPMTAALAQLQHDG